MYSIKGIAGMENGFRLLIGLWVVAMGVPFQPAHACMWDYDTIAMERAQFPEALELITGKFARHSEAFYQWRIEDRLKRIELEPDNLALLDDLAVAYDKVGNHDDAIATMLRKEERQPGLYETAANLGTFYIHAGELEKGLEFIEKAIKINPDAHFGREIYQKHLVEYLLYVREHGNAELPMRLLWPPTAVHEGGAVRSYPPGAEDPGPEQRVAHGFYDWIPIPEVNHEAAVKGVLGMMRFGSYDSPILLEALGDLLAYGPRFGEATGLLASRAFLKASYEVNDEASREKYRELATMAIELQTGGAGNQLTLEELEADFKKELAEAEAWYAQVKADELAWIESGQNPEALFAEKYFKTPVIESSPSAGAPSPTLLEWIGLFGAALGIVFLVYRFSRRVVQRYRTG